MSVLVCWQAGCESACLLVCAHDWARVTCGGCRMSAGCGGCDLVLDQWPRKRNPTPARTRKLETYGYLYLCLNCGESVSTGSYSILRMPLPTLCFREPFCVPEAAGVPFEVGKIILVVCALRSHACCRYECLYFVSVHLVAAGQQLFRHLCTTLAITPVLTVTKLWEWSAPVFPRQRPPVKRQAGSSDCGVCSAGLVFPSERHAQEAALVKLSQR